MSTRSVSVRSSERFIVAGAALLMLLSPRDAHTQRSPDRTWTAGVLVGIASPGMHVGLAGGRGRGAGAISLEVKEGDAARRLRLELLYRAESTSDLCPTCADRISRASWATLGTMVWEFRRSARLRPYWLLGAGAGRSVTDTDRFADCPNAQPCDPVRYSTRTRSTDLLVLSAGLGLTANLGRLSPTLELRHGGPAEFISVGARVRFGAS